MAVVLSADDIAGLGEPQRDVRPRCACQEVAVRQAVNRFGAGLQRAVAADMRHDAAVPLAGGHIVAAVGIAAAPVGHAGHAELPIQLGIADGQRGAIALADARQARAVAVVAVFRAEYLAVGDAVVARRQVHGDRGQAVHVIVFIAHAGLVMPCAGLVLDAGAHVGQQAAGIVICHRHAVACGGGKAAVTGVAVIDAVARRIRGRLQAAAGRVIRFAQRTAGIDPYQAAIFGHLDRTLLGAANGNVIAVFRAHAVVDVGAFGRGAAHRTVALAQLAFGQHQLFRFEANQPVVAIVIGHAALAVVGAQYAQVQAMHQQALILHLHHEVAAGAIDVDFGSVTAGLRLPRHRPPARQSRQTCIDPQTLTVNNRYHFQKLPVKPHPYGLD
ncbi:hypothetical protein GCM10027277_07930 [Pseudoduganella ginsengisoli]